jgi:tRNA(Arg) A34 adenosine deaminase TadA
MWNNLSPQWQACLEEAWAAYCAGCVPIGAVVTNADGHILARGRNHILDDGDAPVSRHELAHAELNALLAFDYGEEDPHTWALYTTLEPCPLCLGAFYMSGLRQLHYAARDPYAGSVNLLGTTPYLSRKPIRAVGPPSADLEEINIALNVESMLQGSIERSQFLRNVWRQVVPRGVALGEKIFEMRLLPALRAASATPEALVDRLSGEMRSL